MRKTICVFVLVQVACLAFSKDLPSNFKKCKRNDSDLNGCLKVAIQEALALVSNGLPAFKIPTLAPLRVDRMTIGQGTGPVQVVQNYKDVDIYNMTDVIVQDVRATATDNKLVLDFDVMQDQMTFKANYNISGKILVLPVVGEGPCTLKLYNLKVKITLIGETVQKKGTEYMRINEVKVSLNPAKLTYNFENLFNGDKQLGDTLNKVLNENDLEVFADVRSGYEEFLGIIIKDIVNKFFEHVPYNVLLAL